MSVMTVHRSVGAQSPQKSDKTGQRFGNYPNDDPANDPNSDDFVPWWEDDEDRDDRSIKARRVSRKPTRPMHPQEIIDRAVRGIYYQRKLGMQDGLCVYLNLKTGHRCAIGHQAATLLDAAKWAKERLSTMDIALLINADETLLEAVQNAHDEAEMGAEGDDEQILSFMSSIQDICKERNLVLPWEAEHVLACAEQRGVS